MRNGSHSTWLRRAAAIGALVGGTAGAGLAVSTAGAARGSTDSAGVTWLCRPGMTADPCLAPQGAISVAADGATTPLPAPTPTAAATDFDCFYIYPTVTASAATSNSGTRVSAAEQATAVAQASRFSSVCRVWAPTYRQRTSASLAKGLGADPTADLVSYHSLLAGWKDYLAHDNHGRPIIFIGHSQGAANLIRLLRGQVDNNATLRRRVVSALILGGNVQVPLGKTVGGTFAHLPACTKPTQTGCVIAYSSFAQTPPVNSLFGRPGQGVSLQSGQTATKGQQVLCANPALLGGSSPAALTPFFPDTATGTAQPWVTYPGLYTAQCVSRGGATWLNIVPRPGDQRPVVSAALGPTWGLHLDDVNLALGNLVADVTAEEASYQAQHSSH
jgi:hypothetical protein